jgi:hypothetical protein
VPRLLRGSGDPLPSGLKHDVIRDPVPLDDSILIVFRLPAAFECPEPADREQAKSARVAISQKAIPSMSASQTGRLASPRPKSVEVSKGMRPPPREKH